MDNRQMKKVVSVFKKYPQIKLVYLFGSRANGNTGPLSDYDFAVYLKSNNAGRTADLKNRLMVKLGMILKNENIDIIILNTSQNPELKYNVIKDGKLIFQRKPFKIIVEPRILNEYFDFHRLLLRYNLTRA